MSSCPSCGTQVAADARFCSNCGNKLAASTPAPPRHRTSEGMRAERRQLTVMFCDIAGSTMLSEQLDPEDLMEVVRRYQQMCAEVIERFGGNIAQYLGDGLLVYFGYPTAYENAPERAARAGLGILEGLDTLNESLRREHGIALKVRLGIHTGLVVIGEVGAGAKREQLAVGDTANIAARLEGMAEPNSGVISEATRILVEGLVETESLGPQDLKGIATPMEIHRLLRLSAARHRLEGTRRLAPFVGRRRELASLQQQWERTEAGQGSAALLVAEAGVGKSRMIRAFQDAVGERRHRLYEAYCSPFYSSTVLHPIVEMLRVEARIDRDDPPTAALSKLAQWLQTQPADDDALPLLATLLEIPPEAGYEAVSLSPQARKLRTIETLLRTLLPAPDGPPVLLVLEDVHWVDPSTLDLVGQLVARLPEQRAMLLATARPSFTSPWSAIEHVHEQRLSPFGQDDTRELVLAMTDGRRLPDRMLAQLVDRTDGIPLFVEELTRMLMDAGQLEETKGSVIPTTLHDSLMARLDRLDPVARKVAQLGATIGRAFERWLLDRIFTGAPRDLQQGIEALHSSQLVFTKSGTHGDGEVYIFKHALIQDAAYESLLKRTRQEYHGRIAAALRDSDGGFTEVAPELLAQHLQAAGRELELEAVRQWLAAGERAQASSSNEEAVTHLRRGLELVPSLPETAERVQLEVSLLSKLGTALSALKGYAAEEVEQTYTRANALCEQLEQTPERFWVLWGLWAFYLVQGTHTKGVRFAERMLELAREQGEEALLLEAHFSLGLSEFFMGDDLAAAREHLDWVVSRYDEERHHQQAFLTGQSVGVTARSVAALVCFQLGALDEAAEHHRQALALSERLDHAFSRAYALGCAAWLQLYLRDFAAAQRFAGEAVALSQEQSFGWWLVWGTILGGSAAAGLREEGAADRIEQGIDLWRQTGSGFTVPYFLGLLCDARRGEGRIEVVGPLLEEARTLADSSRERFFAAELRRLQGRLRLDQGSDGAAVSEAEAAFRAAREVARTQGARAWELRAATDLARLLREHGRDDEGRRLLAEALTSFDAVRPSADVREARALLDDDARS